MERARAYAIATRGEGGPSGKLVLAADHRGEPMLGVIGGIGHMLEPVQHINLRFARQRPPRRDALIEVSDEEHPRARGP